MWRAINAWEIEGIEDISAGTTFRATSERRKLLVVHRHHREI
jgi:hypothetical protein